MAGSQQQRTGMAAGAAHQPKGRAWAVLEALVVAALSPVAPLAPKRFARWFSEHPVLVPAWQIMLLLSYVAFEVAQELSRGSHGPMPLFLVILLVPYAMGLGLAFLVAAYMVRPISSAWDETARWSFWKGGLLLAAFQIPLPVAMGVINTLLETHVLESSAIFPSRHTFNILMATNLAVVSAAMVQIVRGLASAGGKILPDLPPICRECGYSLEGVVEHYRQNGKAGDSGEPAPVVCSECGADLAISLEASARPGTAWTRGEHLSAGSWLRTMGQVVGRPGRFFTGLPLGSSRKAALWFWAGNLALTLVLVTAIFALDYAICVQTRVAGSMLPGVPDPLAVYGVPTSQPQAAPAASPSPLTALWLLESFSMVAGTMLGIAGVTMLTLTASANSICRRVGKHRSMNLYPAGLLLMAYLSPVALGGATMVFAVGVATRLAGEAFLPIAPPILRRYVDQPSVLVLVVGLATLISGLVWFHLVTRRAAKGMQYANR